MNLTPAPYLEVLKNWNFWNNKIDLGVKRDFYLKKLMNYVDLIEVVGLFGVRRSGKSTILLQLIEHLHRSRKIPYKQFLYVNFEDPRFGDEMQAKDLFVLLEEYYDGLKPEGRVYLFLDEVQRVGEWERFVLTVYEQKKNIKIFVTGSSSQLLNNDLSILLSGRVLPVEVTPLDFAEFVGFKKFKKNSKKIRELFDEYLMYGGFPRVVLEENEINKKVILISYYESILEKDVISKNGIKKKTELKNLARFIMSNSGSLISTYALEKSLKISAVNISKYIRMLADAFLITENVFFSRSVKQQIYNPGKIFGIDTGLINVAGFKFSENKGRLLEGVINANLAQKGLQVFYWKNSTEVDFVTFKQNKVEQLINVTLTVDDVAVLNRELSSLDLAGKEVSSQAGQILLTLYNESKQKDKRIVSLIDFLLK